MSKLVRKFLLGLSSILIIVILVSIYLNSNFTQRYFLYREKQDLSRICDQVAAGTDLAETITRLEEETDVVIAWVTDSRDNDLLNERLREAFQKKGLGLGGYGNFWFWEGDRQFATDTEPKLRIYHQQKLPYSLLVQYVSLDKNFIAVAKVIPAVEATISLINQVTACVFSIATLVMIVLVFCLVKRITTPLGRIGETAKMIAQLDFQTVEVHTGDELELLAEDINEMSVKLKTALQALEEKNHQMEALLANVSHDLKTPVSLIKAYTSGIKDDIDDGTFLDTIILQNEKIEQMIESLLDLSRLGQETLAVVPVDLSALLWDTARAYQFQAEGRGLSLDCQIKTAVTLTVSKDTVQTIFSNLISNAVKYANKGSVQLTLCRKGETVLFEIQNEVDPESAIDMTRLWEPFYVAEKSRNKNMSGTGLGLAIVKAATKKCGYSCSCELIGQVIRFTLRF